MNLEGDSDKSTLQCLWKTYLLQFFEVNFFENFLKRIKFFEENLLHKGNFSLGIP